MKKQSLLIRISLSVILILATLFMSSSFTFANENPSGLDGGHTGLDAAVYAKAMNVSLQEAAYRLKFMEIAGNLHAELVENEPGTFGDSWLEHTPTFKMVCQFTCDGEKTITAYLKKYSELKSIIEVRPAKITYKELVDTQTAVMAALAETGVRTSTDIDIKEGTVHVFVVDRKALDEALQQKAIVFPDYVKIDTVSKVGTEECALIGGHSISGNNYMGTTGFTVVDAYGQRFVSTAGHVAYYIGTIALYDGTYQLTRYGYRQQSPLDFGYYISFDQTLTNQVKVSSVSTRAITSVRSYASLQVGEAVFKYGITTGYTFGVIVAKNYDGNFVRCVNPAGPAPIINYGDSGAPCLSGNAAMGIARGRAPEFGENTMVFSSVSFLPTYFGLNVLTTP